PESVAAFVLKLVLQYGVSIQKLRVGVTCDFVLKICKLFLRSDEVGVGSKGFIQYSRALVKIRNLFESSRRKSASAVDRAFVGVLRFGEYTEQCGFAGAVVPDETDLLTGIDLKANVSKNGLGAVGSRYAA